MYARARSSCARKRAQHHSLSRQMSSRAASRAGAACVCAPARRAYSRKEARDTARAGARRRNAILTPCPRIRPGLNGSAGSNGNREARARPLGGAGRRALIRQGARGRGALASPLPTLAPQADGLRICLQTSGDTLKKPSHR